MIYLLNLMTCLFLAVFHTALLPRIPFSDNVFDLGICYVISLCLCHRHRVVVVFALMLGFLMDSLSGGAPGLYMSAYLWLAVSIKGAMNFFKISSLLIVSLVVLIGILFQHAVFLGSIYLVEIDTQISISAVKTAVVQALFGCFAGPFVVHVMSRYIQKWRPEFSNQSTPARGPYIDHVPQ